MSCKCEEFWSKVDQSDGCWIWKAARDNLGYGCLSFNGKLERAHRVAWTLSNGAIPENKSVLHRCDNPSCVRPTHLFLGTQKDNMADCVAKGRLHSLLGEQKPQTKLTAKEVLEMRLLRKQGLTVRALAKLYGVSSQAIWYACRGINWRWLK